MKGSPHISALICTYNRAPLLAHALDALVAQSLPRQAFEVIVSDDGSTDDTSAVVGAYTGRLNLRFLSGKHRGISAAKNAAVVAASAPIIVFVDDDDIAHPDMLTEHLDSHRLHQADTDAVLGFTGLHPSIADDPLMRFVTYDSTHLFSYSAIKDGAELDYTWFWGGRSSCKRRLLLEYGLFDENFTFGAEDIELGYRLSKHGLRVIYNANAQSEMLRALSVDEFCARAEKQGRSNWIFWHKHPTPEIAEWAEIAGLENKWRLINPRFARLRGIATALDGLVRTRVDLGVRVEPSVRDLLHTAYHRAINAARVFGAWTARGATEPVDSPALSPR